MDNVFHHGQKSCSFLYYSQQKGWSGAWISVCTLRTAPMVNCIPMMNTIHLKYAFSKFLEIKGDLRSVYDTENLFLYFARIWNLTRSRCSDSKPGLYYVWTVSTDSIHRDLRESRLYTQTCSYCNISPQRSSHPLMVAIVSWSREKNIGSKLILKIIIFTHEMLFKIRHVYPSRGNFLFWNDDRNLYVFCEDLNRIEIKRLLLWITSKDRPLRTSFSIKICIQLILFFSE